MDNNLMMKEFKITSICREDILATKKFSEEDIKSLDNADMIRLASKMADAYLENGFWIDLPIIVEYILENKKENANNLRHPSGQKQGIQVQDNQTGTSKN